MSKPKYFLYARKSTEDDDKQVMSIESQLYELREFARKEKLEILSEFQESKSAKTPGRPIFGEMMSRIESGEADGVLTWHPDRLARNSIDGGRVIYAVDTGRVVSLRFPTFWFEPTPQGLFMLQVAFGQSKYYSDNLTQNVKRGMKAKRRRGEWLTKAPLGYVNNREKKIIEPHPVYAELVRRAFEEYATGAHGLVSLSHFLHEHGVRTKFGTPLAKCSIKHMLSNRAYLGFVKHHDEWFDGTFDPIISPSLFAAVQTVLEDKAKPQKKRGSHDFPFRNLFRCDECGGMFTAQFAKGNGGVYRYYRCTKKKGLCRQSYVQERDLAGQLKQKLQTIALPDRYTDHLLSELDRLEDIEASDSAQGEQQLSNKLSASESRLEKLVSTYLDGDIPKATYLKQKDAIMRDTLALREEMKAVAGRRNTWVEPLREWVKDTKQAAFLSSSDNFSEIAAFVQKIGTNHAVRDKTAHLTVPPLHALVAAWQPRLSRAAATPPRSSGLSETEVSLCAGERNRTPAFSLEG